MRIAINGFGRIGRNILRSFVENSFQHKKLEIVAVNDLSPIETNAHLLKFDSVHGVFNADVSINDDILNVHGHKIKIFSEKNPEDLPWKELDIDLVFECTGLFTDKDKASAHIKAGAKRVLISAPSANADKMTVFGVNHTELSPQDIIISNASCTTNCLAPIAKVLHEAIGIERGLMTTVHSYTNDQRILDVGHKDLHRARAAALSMIPTSTGAAKAVGKVLPQLNGKLDGFSLRVPTPNVSVVDLTFTPSRKTSVEEVNQAISIAAKNQLAGVLDTNNIPLVSSDFNHNAASSIFDLTQTRIIEDGQLVKVLSWYDNEWGFSNRMLDMAAYINTNLS